MKSGRQSNTQEFIIEAREFHGNKYDYSKVVYEKAKKYVIIICPIHGEFKQKPTNHIKYGCNDCAQEIRIKSIRKNQEYFIEKAFEVHGDLYDYSKAEYKLCNEDVEIICRKHGSFWQTPHLHIYQNAGCPVCVRKVSKAEAEWLDSLSIPKEYRYCRVLVENGYYYADGFDPKTNTVYEFNGDYWHGNPKIFDPNKLNTKTKITFGELYQKTLKKEAALKAAGFNVITMWEYDFFSNKKRRK